jgi:hypothetical protein
LAFEVAPGSVLRMPTPAQAMDWYGRIAGYAARVGRGPRGGDLTLAEWCVFSQNGEDGVIRELLARLGVVGDGYFIEFGVEAGVECNCAMLAELGWRGLFIEGSERFAALAARWGGREGITLRRERVTPGNVNRLFDEAGAPDEPDVLSIDVDGADYWIWDAVTRRARVVVVEYNGSLPTDPRTRLAQPIGAGPWDGTAYFGCSLGALEAAAARKGYRLVHTDLCGVNAFFVRADLLTWAPTPARRAANYSFGGGGHPPDPHGRPFVEV